MKTVIGAILAAAHLEDDGIPTTPVLPSYRKTEEAEKTWAAFEEALATYCSEDIAEEMTAPLGDVARAYEYQGFVNGFRYGFMLANELNEDTKTANSQTFGNLAAMK